MKIKNSYYYAKDYDIPKGFSPREFIRKMLKMSHKINQDARKERFGSLKLTLTGINKIVMKKEEKS